LEVRTCLGGRVNPVDVAEPFGLHVVVVARLEDLRVGIARTAADRIGAMRLACVGRVQPALEVRVDNGLCGRLDRIQTVHAGRTNSATLEIHKHLDGIVYYVGYASPDHIEKYLTRQKNFHILVSLEPRGKASVLFEIPVDFVTKCTVSSAGGGSVFDLFVMAIPELQSFRRGSDFREPEV